MLKIDLGIHVLPPPSDGSLWTFDTPAKMRRKLREAPTRTEARPDRSLQISGLEEATTDGSAPVILLKRTATRHLSIEISLAVEQQRRTRQ
jgi:hypothetical protein